jgi:hypothetical protein
MTRCGHLLGLRERKNLRKRSSPSHIYSFCVVSSVNQDPLQTQQPAEPAAAIVLYVCTVIHYHIITLLLLATFVTSPSASEVFAVLSSEFCM